MQSTNVNFIELFGRLRTGAARLAAAAILCASATLSARASNCDFAVSESVAADRGVSSLARADDLLAGDMACASSRTVDDSVINFKNADQAGRMHFPGSLPFPVAEPRDDHNFAMHITGDVEIPEPGNCTFGVKSNGGFHLQIGDESMERDASHGGCTRIVPFSFEKPGTYSIDLSYYEQAPRATLELFACEGRFHRFGARGADWHLVGDSADGGLCLTTDPTSPNCDPTPPSDGSSPGSPVTGDSSVPEPDGLLVCAVALPWLLSRRWRRARAVNGNSISRSNFSTTKQPNFTEEASMRSKLLQIIKSCSNSLTSSNTPSRRGLIGQIAIAAIIACVGLR